MTSCCNITQCNAVLSLSQNKWETGTLATNQDGWPLATYSGYGLDLRGQPLLRLRDAALKTQNITADSRASIYLQVSLHSKSFAKGHEYEKIFTGVWGLFVIGQG